MAQFTTLFSERQPTFHYSLGHGLTFKTSAILSTSSSCSISPPVKTLSVTSKLGEQQPLRRSGNYQPPTWDFCYVESLSNQYSGKRYINRCLVLKEQVKMMLDEEVDLLIQLELIDDLQRLGIAYHFQNKIQSILSGVYKENHLGNTSREKDFYATALEFRLLRQHGFGVSQEVFNCFKNEKGNFKANLCEDIKGMLHLYEASFLLVESESTLEMAREFSSECLKNVLNHEGISEELILLVQHSLELPLHWRVQRLEARWFIDMYEKRANRNPTLLDLAKIDFNLVQATHQDDLQYASRWWQSTCLAENLAFARDRLVENFFWTVGVIFDPQQGYCRRMSTRVNALVTTIDDVYDVYGTLDELELFTAAVERWDLGVIDQLPSYLKLCYFALYNSINEMAYDVTKEQGVHVISYLKNSWTDLCKAYLQEAKWYHSGYVPTLQEYLDNAWISISAPVILVHAYFFVSNPITNEALECLDRYHNIIRCSAMILRLADDLGTSTDELQRGDVPKSIQCYMNESGASEEEACEHIRFLISETWKQMNKERVADSPFSQTFIGMAMNLGRMAQCMYQYGDGHGSSNSQTRDRIRALLLDPVGLSF